MPTFESTTNDVVRGTRLSSDEKAFVNSRKRRQGEKKMAREIEQEMLANLPPESCVACANWQRPVKSGEFGDCRKQVVAKASRPSPAGFLERGEVYDADVAFKLGLVIGEHVEHLHTREWGSCQSFTALSKGNQL